jgi:hypothetical protein
VADGGTIGSMEKETEALRHDGALLVEQIKYRQDTIARSLELLKRIDEMLAKAGETFLEVPNGRQDERRGQG